MTVTPLPPSILVDLALVLGVAAVTTVACQRLRLPVVVGYLLAGLIIGPHVPVPLVADQGNVHTLSELGVILLMFSIGLEFSLRKLLRADPSAALVAIIQASFMTWAGYLVGRLLGWGAIESIFAGSAIAISSTMIIARVFANLGVKGPLSELVLSALIVEDLLAIVMLTLLTAVGSGSGLSFPALLLTLARLAGFLVVVLALGRWFLPRFVRWVADQGNDETLLVTAVGLCFTFSLLAAKAGYSVALGAFLAGMMVAESGRERKVEHLLQPVRDMFVAVFFVSIGMLIDPAQLAPNWRALLAFGALVLVGKFASAALGALLGGNSLRLSLRTGASLLPRVLRHFLTHHRVAMGHLRAMPLRKGDWSHLRRPFSLLLLDGLAITLLAGVGALIQRTAIPALEARGLPHRLAALLVWAGILGLILRLSAGLLGQVRRIARSLAARALQASGDTTEGVEEATRLCLEAALGGVDGELIFAPRLDNPGLIPALALAALAVGGILLWRRLRALRLA